MGVGCEQTLIQVFMQPSLSPSPSPSSSPSPSHGISPSPNYLQPASFHSYRRIWTGDALPCFPCFRTSVPGPTPTSSPLQPSPASRHATVRYATARYDTMGKYVAMHIRAPSNAATPQLLLQLQHQALRSEDHARSSSALQHPPPNQGSDRDEGQD